MMINKNRHSILFVSLLGLVLILGSCKETENTTPGATVNVWDTVTNFQGIVNPSNSGTLTFKMNYAFKGAALEFGSKYYTNAAADTFTIKELRHYLSNIILHKPNGDIVNLKNYNLLDASVVGSQTFTIQNVPAGNYTGVSFLLAVDSFANHNGLQEGALDPSWGMFWTWNTGYIFYRINGATTKGKNYSFDLGGDGNQPGINLDLKTYKVKSNKATFNMLMEVNEMFQNPENYSFEVDGYTIHSETEPSAKKFAKNMSDMVTISNITP